MRRHALCGLAVVAALGSAAADEPATGPADRIVRSVVDAEVREVLEDVLERNPELAAMALRVSAAGHRTASVRKLPDPRAEVTAFVLPPETRVGPQRFAARISQQIPGGGKRAISEKTADLDRRALAAELQAQRLEKVSETRRLLAEIRYIDEARRVLADDRATLAHFEELARARYASGSGLQMDAVQIQTELTRLEARMAELVERRGALAAEVNRLRDRPGAVIAEGSAPPVRPTAFDWDDLRELALDSRPELDAVDARIEGSQAATELAAKAASPDFNVGLTYAYVDRRTDVDVPKNGRDVLGISGGINIPIWRTGTTAAVEESTRNRLAVEASRRTTVAGIDRELEALRRRIPEIRRRLALLEEVLPIQSRQALSSAVSAYAAGRVDALALLEAERVLLDVRLSAARGRTDLALALIDLEAAIAGPLPTGGLS